MTRTPDRNDPYRPRWRDEFSDGCTWIPDAYPHLPDFRHCCVKHDQGHYEGWTKEHWKEGDITFYWCLREVAAKAPNWKQRWAMRMIARVRYTFVRAFGWRLFSKVPRKEFPPATILPK